MAIDTNKDTDLIPARKNFSVISHIDSDIKDREVNLLQEKLSDALKKYLVSYPQERERFNRMQSGIDTITRVYAESLFEVSYVLGIKDFGLELEEISKITRGPSESPFGTITFAYARRGDDGNFIVGINAYEFFDEANKWNYSPIVRKGVQKDIYSSVAEEVSHIYAALKYPQTFSRTKNADSGNWDEYCKDRGEIFAKVFVKEYLKYKNLTS